jgi:ABC-2 type transport system ATP-binding protein
VTGLDELPGVHNPQVERNRVRFDVDTADIDGALKHLTAFGIRSLTSQPPTLEELFLRHYGDELPSEPDIDVEGDGQGRRGRRGARARA